MGEECLQPSAVRGSGFEAPGFGRSCRGRKSAGSCRADSDRVAGASRLVDRSDDGASLRV